MHVINQKNPPNSVSIFLVLVKYCPTISFKQVFTVKFPKYFRQRHMVMDNKFRIKIYRKESFNSQI